MSADKIDSDDGEVAEPAPAGRRGSIIMLAAIVLAVALAGYRFVPNVRGLGSLVDSGAPFLGLGIPVLALAALLRRSCRALAAVLLPAFIWAALFGAAWSPRGGGPVEFRVVTQNVKAGNRHPATTLRAVAAVDADLVALQELPPGQRGALADALRDRYPYRAVQSTVGLWSRWPIRESVGVDTGLEWTRALRAVVAVPKGDVVVYVVHLGSVRAGHTTTRDHTVDVLAAALRRDAAQRIILLGDLNTATTDRVMAPLAEQLRDAQADAGHGFGFTWPSAFPVTRPDHVLYRGLTAASADVVRTPESDHRAVVAGFRR